MNPVVERMSDKEVLDKTIEMWEELAEDGSRRKQDWPGWDGILDAGPVRYHCLLCDKYRENCSEEPCAKCPYYQTFGRKCFEGTEPFSKWEDATDDEDKSYWARRFTLRLYRIRKQMLHKETPKPFYMVIKESGSGSNQTTMRHTTFAEATGEAVRLAVKAQGNFIILTATHIAVPDTTVDIKEIE